jgi:hypothetical protein
MSTGCEVSGKNGESQCRRILPNPTNQRDHLQTRQGDAKFDGGQQVDCIESSHRLNRKRIANFGQQSRVHR